MKKDEKFRRSSAANFTPQELAKSKANLAYVAKRFPEEQARASARIEHNGLGNHREVIKWYLDNKSPIPSTALAGIQLYQDTTYAGSFGRGEQQEGSGNGPEPKSLAERLYRPAIKPGGAQ